MSSKINICAMCQNNIPISSPWGTTHVITFIQIGTKDTFLWITKEAGISVEENEFYKLTAQCDDHNKISYVKLLASDPSKKIESKSEQPEKDYYDMLLTYNYNYDIINKNKSKRSDKLCLKK